MFESLRKLTRLDSDTLQRALALQAEALERYALDFLWLDMSVFDEFEQLIKARIARHPQRMTVWVPTGTPEDAVAKTVSEARRADSQVPVDVREYERPPKGKVRRRWPWRR